MDGSIDTGTVFTLNPKTGSVATVFTFPGTASGPLGSFALTPDCSTIYGITAGGGSNGTGTVYRLTLTSSVTAAENDAPILPGWGEFAMPLALLVGMWAAARHVSR